MRFASNLAIILMVFCANAPAKASEFISRDHLVIDLKYGVEWLRCSVGQVWNGEDCIGDIIKLNHDEIAIAIEQANEQLGPTWRLPSKEELEGLVCESCERPKISAKYFPNTSAEPYWTGDSATLAPRHTWSVNFFTGHAYGRFFPYQRLAVRFVRDRR